MKNFDLEQDLYASLAVREAMQADPTLAQELYAALCNTQFRHDAMPADDPAWSCTWRYAGDIVATLVNPEIQDYLDYYCSGNEGVISPRVEALLASLGWVSTPFDDGIL